MEWRDGREIAAARFLTDRIGIRSGGPVFARRWIYSAIMSIPLFEQKAALFLDDPWDVRNMYIQVVLHNHSTLREFLSETARKTLSDGDLCTLATLLEMQRNRMLMYTSCGWFFDDVSGLESLQILRYAARVLQLAQRWRPNLMTLFLAELHAAVSNVKPYLSGDKLFLQQILPQMADLTQVLAHVAMFSVFQNVPIQDRFSCYQIKAADFTQYESGERVLLIAHAYTTSHLTLEMQQVVGAVAYLGGLDFRCSVAEFVDGSHYESLKEDLSETFHSQSSTELIRKLDQYFPGDYFSLKNLFAEQRSQIIGTITRKMYEDQALIFDTFYEKNRDLAKLIISQSERLPDTFLASARFVLNRSFLNELDKLAAGCFPDALESLMEEAELWKIHLDVSSAEKLISTRVLDLVERLWESPFDEILLTQIIQFLDLARDLEIPLQLGEPQIMLMRIIRSLAEIPTPVTSQRFCELADRLAVRLNSC